jgi:hypothetical protein
MSCREGVSALITYSGTRAWLGNVTEVVLGPVEWGDSDEGQLQRTITVRTKDCGAFTMVVRGDRAKALKPKRSKSEVEWLNPRLYKG